MKNLTIRIYESGDGGYKYDIYDYDIMESINDGDIEEEIDEFNRDGGHCTGTIKEAIGMASEQALKVMEK